MCLAVRKIHLFFKLKEDFLQKPFPTDNLMKYKMKNKSNVSIVEISDINQDNNEINVM